MRSLKDEIAQDNSVRLIDALVEQLDLNQLKVTIPKASEGHPAFHPKVFLKLYFVHRSHPCLAAGKCANHPETDTHNLSMH